MLTDTELLRRYAEDRSEAAFGELVARHVNLVYYIPGGAAGASADQGH